MALQAYINDTILVNDKKCTVVGININYYKSNNNFVSYIEYVLFRNNNYWYLDEYFFSNNEYYIYRETNHNALANFLLTGSFADNISKIKKDIYINKAEGNTLWNEGEILKCKQYIVANNLYLSKKNNRNFIGFKINSLNIYSDNNNIEKLFNNNLPDITQFHNDNLAKNTKKENKGILNVGDGFIFNDNEYFVISKSGIKNISKANEYKIYNNIEKKYCWLKYYKLKYWLCEETTSETFTFYSNGSKILQNSRILINNDTDFETTINNKYDYNIFTKNEYIYINEQNNNKALYFIGKRIIINKLTLLEYKYKRPISLINIKNEKIYHRKGISDGCDLVMLLFIIFFILLGLKFYKVLYIYIFIPILIIKSIIFKIKVNKEKKNFDN
ncbi:MAG: hypothetical protein MJ211_10270 [Bacteroidales bacterium]|nr:hypothetical protein [Bacteroidales bacterium]